RGERPIVPDDVADRIGHRRLLLAAIVQRGSQRSDHASGLAGGAYQLEPFANADVEAAGLILDRYADLGLGLTDASLLADAWLPD
ncbi:MAG: hypothetical protein ABI573_07525, partial [Chloroflexota bacterium]